MTPDKTQIPATDLRKTVIPVALTLFVYRPVQRFDFGNFVDVAADEGPAAPACTCAVKWSLSGDSEVWIRLLSWNRNGKRDQRRDIVMNTTELAVSTEI